MTLHSDLPKNAWALPPVGPMDGPTASVAVHEPSTNERGLLLHLAGVGCGRLYSLTAPIHTFGRGRECTAHFDDVTLSRVHARVRREGRRFLFEDMNSRNGSFVNGRRVDCVELRDGDRIRLGATAVFRFQLVTEEEGQALDRMFQGAMRDPVTGAFNQRHLMSILTREIAYAARQRADFSIVTFEVDRFAQVIGAYGQQACEGALRQLVENVEKHLRVDDSLGRLDSGQLAIVARGMSLADAHAMAEHLRARIVLSPLKVGARTVRVTASFGVTSFACARGERTAEGMLETAEDALAQAKASGSNYVAAG